MPKYDYRCSAGHQYEKREGFDAPAEQECQVCGAHARRVLTAPAIVFKGSGWYVNDSRKSGRSSTDLPGSTASSSDGASDGAGESKTETKVDAKPESSAPSTAAAD